MKGKEIKEKLEDKSGYDKEIIENNFSKNKVNKNKFDKKKNIMEHEIKFDREQNIVENKYDNNKVKDNKLDIEVGEDVTAYGEFISSYFAWIPLSKQKRRAEELNEITKNKKDTGK